MTGPPAPTPAPAAPLPAGTVLRVALWVGGLAGFGEVLLQLAIRYGWHRFNFTGRDLPWLTPAAYSLLFVGFGLLLLVLARLRPALRRPGMVMGLLAFPAMASLAFMYTPLHRAAALVLALGIAVQAGRWAAVPDGWLTRLLRRTWALPLVLIVVLAAWVRGGSALAERRALAALPAPPAGGPNILYIFLDTVRSASLTLGDTTGGTSPFLARLALRGVNFAEARSPAPWTLPSHASAFTGKPANALTADWLTPLDDETPVLAEELARRGWVTGGFVGNTLYCSRETGLARGFSHFRDYTASPGEWVRSVSLLRVLHGNRTVRRLLGIEELLGRKKAPDVSAGLLAWLDDRPAGRPFFAFVNYFDAHNPYIPPAEFSAGLPPGPPSLELETLGPGELPAPAVLADLRDRYERSIAGLDRNLERLFAELDRRGLLDSTLVIITSDHGEQFGEHQLIVHGNSLYLPNLHVPLLMALPGRLPAGRVIHAPVALYDLPATIAELAGVRDMPLPGRSLARFWTDTGEVSVEPILTSVNYSPLLRKVNPVSRGDIRGIEQDGWRYIRQRQDEQLYRLSTDRGERENLVGAEAGGRLPPIRAALDSVLDRWPRP